MDRQVVEAFRSAVAVMTAVVDQYDEDEMETTLQKAGTEAGRHLNED